MKEQYRYGGDIHEFASHAAKKLPEPKIPIKKRAQKRVGELISEVAFSPLRILMKMEHIEVQLREKKKSRIPKQT